MHTLRRVPITWNSLFESRKEISNMRAKVALVSLRYLTDIARWLAISSDMLFLQVQERIYRFTITCPLKRIYVCNVVKKYKFLR